MHRLAMWIAKGIEFLSSALAVIGGVVLCSMISFVTYGAVMRYFFKTPKAWVNETVGLMYLPLIAFGIAYTLKLKGHVRVELLVSRMPVKMQHVLDSLTMPLFLLYTALIVWAGWRRAVTALTSNMHSIDARIAFFPVWVLLPVGAAVLFLQGLVELGKSIAALRGGQGKVQPQQH